ncbi:MAG: PAAR domain-containing protein [Clostridia bacterium]|nr:PAAR domain-containing protein [Clostridia bacterium]
MGKAAAKKGDSVKGVDAHLIQTPTPDPPKPMPHQFDGVIDGDVSENVFIMKMPAATVGSKVSNSPAHLPVGGTFAESPSNKGTVISGSSTVFINKKAAARDTDTVMTCNYPKDAPNGKVKASGNVYIG